jgi:hypothetical protein
LILTEVHTAIGGRRAIAPAWARFKMTNCKE